MKNNEEPAMKYFSIMLFAGYLGTALLATGL